MTEALLVRNTPHGSVLASCTKFMEQPRMPLLLYHQHPVPADLYDFLLNNTLWAEETRSLYIRQSSYPKFSSSIDLWRAVKVQLRSLDMFTISSSI